MIKWILRLEGGLGNQLFQYAHTRALQIKYGGEIYFDTHAYTSKQIRQLSLNHLNIPPYKNSNELSLFEKSNLRMKQFLHNLLMRCYMRNLYRFTQKTYEKIVRCGIYLQYQTPTFDSFKQPVCKLNYVSGNYLTEPFFAGAEEILRKELLVKEPFGQKSEEVFKHIQSCNSVCLHVRLGDYLAPEWKDKLYICTPEYYQKAVELMKMKIQNPVFFIFSNRPKDFEWIKEHIHLDAEIVYVNLGNSDYEDFKLMYSCKHFIMSNSTYSWWAQWLGEYSQKVVIAPSRFNNFPRWDMSGIYMDSWNLIDL